MKKYLISMNYDSNRQPSYVLTTSDYDNNGFVDINVEDFAINTREEAEKIKQELEDYARANGDNYTTFTIEEI
jgi:hypothetical protein